MKKYLLLARLSSAAGYLFFSGCLGATLALVACEQQPTIQPGPAAVAPAGRYQVEELFTKNGCTVYRFEDEDTKRPVYFTDCRGQVTSSYREGGKHKRTREQQTLVE